MSGTQWPHHDTDALLAIVRETPRAGPTALHAQLVAAGVERYTYNAVHSKLKVLGLDSAVNRVAWAATQTHDEQIAEHRPDLATKEWDKKEGGFNWRDANKAIGSMQALKRESSTSQDESHIAFPDAARPMCVIAIADWHWGSWATSHEAIESITDEILSIPDLYIAILSDMEQMSIKMRSVLEVSDNVLPPKMQSLYTESWLAEVAPKVLFATWDNHSVLRNEAQSGYSRYADIMGRNVIYYNGIGHCTLQVGTQEYKIAASHFFRGRSMYNPLHSHLRYVRHEAPDREVIMAGDSHVPGIMQMIEGGMQRVAINTGSLQLNSGYAKRFFSLKTHPVFPCLEFDHAEHRITPFWSIRDWLRATGRTTP